MGTIPSILRVSLSVVLGLAVVTLAGAQSIFKCMDGEATAYQSVPCANAQTQTRLVTVARVSPADAPSQPAASIPQAERSVSSSRGRAWPFRRTLVLGMSDDEVLNLPGWGIPTRITRTKAHRGWREEWSYGSAMNGERRLHFANATLVEVVDVSPMQQVASLILQ